MSTIKMSFTLMMAITSVKTTEMMILDIQQRVARRRRTLKMVSCYCMLLPKRVVTKKIVPSSLNYLLRILQRVARRAGGQEIKRNVGDLEYHKQEIGLGCPILRRRIFLYL